MIGIFCKILDVMLLNLNVKQLFYEVLCIFMCEVCVIVNFCFICLLLCDFDSFYVISLLMLFIQKGFIDIFLQICGDIKEIYKVQWKYV